MFVAVNLGIPAEQHGSHHLRFCRGRQGLQFQWREPGLRPHHCRVAGQEEEDAKPWSGWQRWVTRVEVQVPPPIRNQGVTFFKALHFTGFHVYTIANLNFSRQLCTCFFNKTLNFKSAHAYILKRNYHLKLIRLMIQ